MIPQHALGDTEHQRPERPSRIGQVLCGKYTILRELGAGGMGTVYEALHRNGRRCALKLLAREISSDPDLRKRFLREGYAANAVDHPRIVQIVDDDVAEDGSAFLVMELLRGESLASRAENRGGRLPELFVLTAARDLLEALAIAHQRGIIHRDLKPDNVFWVEGFGVKILDFGIARLRSQPMQSVGTIAGSILGTPGFMAPEQAVGDTGSIDGRTDLWAVGATMFFLLTGELVHDASTVEAMLARTATTAVRPIGDVVPGLSESTQRVVAKSLALRREDRFATAAEMHHAISTALAALPADPAVFAPTHPGAPIHRAAAAVHDTPSVMAAVTSPRSAPRRGLTAVLAIGTFVLLGLGIGATSYFWNATHAGAVVAAGPLPSIAATAVTAPTAAEPVFATQTAAPAAPPAPAPAAPPAADPSAPPITTTTTTATARSARATPPARVVARTTAPTPPAPPAATTANAPASTPPAPTAAPATDPFERP